MAEIDYYDILGVRPTASPSEIKAAYHRAVRSAHPDAGGTAGMFQLVTEAYRTLADPHARASYDARAGRGAVPADPPGPGPEPAAPEADWGEEVSWEADAPPQPPPGAPDAGTPTASDADEFVDRQFSRLDRWMLSGSGHTAIRWATVVAAVIYAALTYIVVAHPGLVRPEAAGADAWGDLLESTPVLRFVLIAYAVFAIGGYIGVFWIPLAAVHAATFVGFLAWFGVYWGIAGGAERFVFGGVFMLWLVYCTAMTVVPLLRGYRYRASSQPA